MHPYIEIYPFIEWYNIFVAKEEENKRVHKIFMSFICMLVDRVLPNLLIVVVCHVMSCHRVSHQ